jgi:biopolymer transport protein ExbD
MAMHLGPGDEEDSPMSQINTTPLVDVMLVLLIIFLITIPAVTASIKVSLPKQKVEVRETKPENIVISVDQAGHSYWYDTPLAGRDDLVSRLKKIAVLQPQPEVQIRGDDRAHYGGVGRILYACQLAGIAKVTFITEPPANGG